MLSYVIMFVVIDVFVRYHSVDVEANRIRFSIDEFWRFSRRGQRGRRVFGGSGGAGAVFGLGLSFCLRLFYPVGASLEQFFVHASSAGF